VGKTPWELKVGLLLHIGGHATITKFGVSLHNPPNIKAAQKGKYPQKRASLLKNSGFKNPPEKTPLFIAGGTFWGEPLSPASWSIQQGAPL